MCVWGYWCRRESDQRAVPVARSAIWREGGGGEDVDVAVLAGEVAVSGRLGEKW